MPFNFDNYARHVGSRVRSYSGGESQPYEWYQWKVFMDEPDERLNQVRAVEYRLHETFANPIRIIEDRDSHFALKSSGWGVFWIYIIIYLNDGTEEYTRYYLDLHKPWPADDDNLQN